MHVNQLRRRRGGAYYGTQRLEVFLFWCWEIFFTAERTCIRLYILSSHDDGLSICPSLSIYLLSSPFDYVGNCVLMTLCSAVELNGLCFVSRIKIDN
jgi:hypothetical protein